MKGAVKHIFLYAFALFITSSMFDGLTLSGGFQTLLIGGILLAIGFKILRPVINIITLPFNMITFGLFSILTTAFILFLITLVYPSIHVAPFYFHGFNSFGVEIHPFQVTLLLSYVIISATIYLITKIMLSLFD